MRLVNVFIDGDNLGFADIFTDINA